MKYNKYLRPLARACVKVFEEMAKMKINSSEVKSNINNPNIKDYLAAVTVSYKDEEEKLEGNFVLGFSDKDMATKLATAIAKNMRLPPLEEFDDMTQDILSEYMNTVVGQTVAEWDEMGLSVAFSSANSTGNLSFIEADNLSSTSYLVILKIGASSMVITVSFNETFKSSLEGKRVLVVDDSKMIRTLLSKKFEKEGCQISLAANGHEAVEVFKSFQPDLTIMDLVMPEMGGLDAIAHIRELDPETKIVVLTSSSKKSEVTTAAKLKVKGYLKKPLDIEKLIAMARSYFDE
jgi:CheY-like chemotaxis protein/CheY-specific phosphatase CheX